MGVRINGKLISIIDIELKRNLTKYRKLNQDKLSPSFMFHLKIVHNEKIPNSTEYRWTSRFDNLSKSDIQTLLLDFKDVLILRKSMKFLSRYIIFK